MPTYEYSCKNCGRMFEKKVPFGYSKKPKCPSCKANNTKKLLSMPEIIFKGSGFHKTDYRKKEPPCKKCPKKEVCEKAKKKN